MTAPLDLSSKIKTLDWYDNNNSLLSYQYVPFPPSCPPIPSSKLFRPHMMVQLPQDWKKMQNLIDGQNLDDLLILISRYEDSVDFYLTKTMVMDEKNATISFEACWKSIWIPKAKDDNIYEWVAPTSEQKWIQLLDCESVLLWILMPVTLATLMDVFPTTMTLKKGDHLSYGADMEATSPHYFRTMSFSHLPPVGMDCLASPSLGLTHLQNYNYTYMVKQTLFLLNLRQVNMKRINIPVDFALNFEGTNFMKTHLHNVHTLKDTGLSGKPSAIYLSRAILTELLTGYIGEMLMIDDEDADIVASLCSGTTIVGWYGCDNYNNWMQAQVLLWSAPMKAYVRFVESDSDCEEDKKDNNATLLLEQPLNDDHKRPREIKKIDNDNKKQKLDVIVIDD